MIENLINDIEQAMLGVLNNEQMSQLRKVLDYAFRDINVSSKNNEECSGNSELIYQLLKNAVFNTIIHRINIYFILFVI